MTGEQFKIFITEIITMKKEIIDKLEEIRCGLMDVEDEIIETRLQG